MNIRSKTFITLAGIIFLAFFLRFWQLGLNPPSLTWDEVAWGYNAYSLGLDGRDEFGKFLPVQYLESFGDFKPPLYAYLDILPVKLFGLNEFAVRFPSAFFGVLTVLITYFLTKRIFPNTQFVPLLAAGMLTISPWHINLSRVAFEANVATFFIVLGVFLFLTAISFLSRGVASFSPRRWNTIDTSVLTLSVVSFIASMYTFNTARIVAPLLFLGLAIGFRRELFSMRRQVAISALVGLIFISPLVQFILTPQAKLRFQEVNIFSDISVVQRANQEIANDGGVWWSKVLHNRRFAYGVEFLKHYFDNLNPGFLFIKGDGNPKFSTQDVGEMYLWDLPFFILGILFLFRKRQGNWWLIPLWLVIGIMPAATARETPHALRIETTLPTFQILVAYGFSYFLIATSNIKKQIANIQIKYLIFTLSFIFLIFNFLYYFHGYYTHYPREYSGEWQYGYKDTINYIKNVEDGYDKIVVTEALGRPYIYMLFYAREDPKFFRETAKFFREVYGFVHVEGYGKYVFTKDPRRIRQNAGKVLYVDVPNNIPGNANIQMDVKLLNGNEALIIYTL